jgi:hydroxymethylpyrimidine pyrophosphatase-like HAD family hydrolase
MTDYDTLYRLYEEFDTAALRDNQEFVDVFPPVDSRVGLDYWADARQELEERREAIRRSLGPEGDTLAEIASRATREQAFTALDLLSTYDRGVNALVLDVDETLRSAGSTDNEIPRETLHVITELVESGVPLVVCTGQTLENVKGFAVQGLGNELVHSGSVSIVYEAGTGVFAPGHGPQTKQLLYEGLDPAVRSVFDRLRVGALSEAPEDVRRGCHRQGNEFNVTLKPNFETGSESARTVVDRGMIHLLDLLGTAVGEELGLDTDPAADWARSFYADVDPEDAGDREDADAQVSVDVPAEARDLFERIDAAYYEADAAEIGSLELNKVVGVEAALDVLGVEDPFVLVMGDSKTDLRVMEWAAENDAGIAAAPDHASEAVLDHVRRRDGLVFDRGDAAAPLRVVYALNSLAGTTR